MFCEFCCEIKVMLLLTKKEISFFDQNKTSNYLYKKMFQNYFVTRISVLYLRRWDSHLEVFRCTHTQTHTHTHTYKYARTHMHTHAHTHVHTPTHTNTYTHAPAHAHTHLHMHTHMHSLNDLCLSNLHSFKDMHPPKIGEIALQTPRTSRLLDC